ncbi:hypothetical protein IPC749_31605 [Pseudomonas aeruginosa]|nr:hypothetical protein CGU39_00025 [Pseudomonas aeruginosa]RPW32135.1 hypothetical protein IPC749_31605 [Pseudomonas aeruginosa]
MLVIEPVGCVGKQTVVLISMRRNHQPTILFLNNVDQLSKADSPTPMPERQRLASIKALVRRQPELGEHTVSPYQILDAARGLEQAKNVVTDVHFKAWKKSDRIFAEGFGNGLILPEQVG